MHDIFNGQQYIRMKLTPELIDKGILDICINKQPRQISISYQHEGQQMKPIIIPVLEFPYPTVDQIDGLVNGNMSLEALTELKAHIIKKYPHWNQIYAPNDNHLATKSGNDEAELAAVTPESGSELTKQNNLTKSKVKLTKEDIDFVLDTVCKEAEHDKQSIKQLFYGMASAFTKNPIPHNVNSKNSGAGKSYLLNLASSYFPEKHVMILAGASDKAFLHREGIMVIKDQETGELKPIGPIIFQLEQEIEELKQKQGYSKNKEHKRRIKEIESEIKGLIKYQHKLIDLDNTIIIIQDTPQDSLVVNLMSLMSQDSQRDQEYIFADKSSSGKIVSGSNIIRGMPVLFTTRVIDDTKHARFEETNRRSINVTPDVSKEKINSAINLIAAKYGLLPDEYDEKVVSRPNKEKAKCIVSEIVEKLKHHTKYLGPKESGIKIPFSEAIAHSIPSDDVWSMTVMDRLMRYLLIITKVNMDNRPRFVNIETGAFYPISTFEDLKETLTLMERGASNIRPYIAEWYNKVFIPAFAELPEKPNSKVIEISGRETTITEERRGLTSIDLTEKTKEILKIPKPSSDEMLKKYLYPLLNQGVIDKVQSQINKNNNLYFPSDEQKTSIFTLFVNNSESQDLKLQVDSEFYPSLGVVEESLGIAIASIEEKHHAEGRVEKIKKNTKFSLEGPDGEQITPKQLVDKYLSNPGTCFEQKN